MPSCVIRRYANAAPPDIAGLMEEASREGFSFVERTATQWSSGENRFDAPAEGFWLAEDDGHVVAMCGVNVDPYVDDLTIGRLRHLYVHPASRSMSLAVALVDVVLAHATNHFEVIRLQTPTAAADRFYDRYGFARSDSQTASHVLCLR